MSLEERNYKRNPKVDLNKSSPGFCRRVNLLIKGLRVTMYEKGLLPNGPIEKQKLHDSTRKLVTEILTPEEFKAIGFRDGKELTPDHMLVRRVYVDGEYSGHMKKDLEFLRFLFDSFEKRIREAANDRVELMAKIGSPVRLKRSDETERIGIALKNGILVDIHVTIHKDGDDADAKHIVSSESLGLSLEDVIAMKGRHIKIPYNAIIFSDQYVTIDYAKAFVEIFGEYFFIDPRDIEARRVILGKKAPRSRRRSSTRGISRNGMGMTNMSREGEC